MLAYETKASVEIEAKTKTFSLEAEARPRRLKFQPSWDRADAPTLHYCASRRARDRGVKTQDTSQRHPEECFALLLTMHSKLLLQFLSGISLTSVPIKIH